MWAIPGLQLSDRPDAHNRRPLFFYKRLHLLAIQNNRPVTLDAQDGNSNPPANLDGPESNTRNIEAHVVIWLRHLDRHRAAFFSSKFAAANQALIGSFERFNREHRAFLDHNHLPDIQTRNLFPDLET